MQDVIAKAKQNKAAEKIGMDLDSMVNLIAALKKNTDAITAERTAFRSEFGDAAADELDASLATQAGAALLRAAPDLRSVLDTIAGRVQQQRGDLLVTIGDGAVVKA